MSTKISKNIKRLRTDISMTQDTLAEKICVSRQAVSSWENDRTQPDIEMLQKLAEVFDVSLEEIIYGKKRNTELENEKKNYGSVLVIVFSILGAFLACAGVILIFVNFWQDLPYILKNLFSFVPFICGAVGGSYVLVKKRESIPFREGAAVLWSAGIVATVLMLENLALVNLDYEIYMCAICVLVLPVAYFLKSVSGLCVHYVFLCIGMINLCQSSYRGNRVLDYATVLLFTVLTILGACYFFKKYKEEKTTANTFCVWLSSLAGVIMTLLLSAASGDTGFFIIGLCCLSLAFLIIGEKEPSYTLPFKILGVLGLAVAVICFASSDFPTGMKILKAERFVGLLFVFALPIISLFVMKPKKPDGVKTALLFFTLLSLVIYTVGIFLISKEATDFLGAERSEIGEKVFLPLKFMAFIVYILMIVAGAREKRLYSIDVGFIFLVFYTMLLVAQSNTSMFINGILLMIFGGLLLFINFRISKSKFPVSEAKKEVQDDEK